MDKGINSIGNNDNDNNEKATNRNSGQLGDNVKKKEKKKTEKVYDVTFRGNRTREIKIKRTRYIFEGRQTKQFTQSEINHPDFIQQEKDFVVTEG